MLIKIRYYFSIANVLYIQEKFGEAERFARKALDLSSDDKNISYETLTEVQKHKKEL